MGPFVNPKTKSTANTRCWLPEKIKFRLNKALRRITNATHVGEVIALVKTADRNQQAP